MMDKLILRSVENRYLVITAALLFSIFGIYVSTTVPVDVFPDLTAPTVVVLTEALGFSPSEVENLVTFPLETALNGAPGVRRVRSASMPGYSVVWAEFEWSEQMNTARQIVAERVAIATVDMPDGVMPPILAPPTSLMGEIQLIALQSETLPLLELRNYTETVLSRRLLAVPGIAQVTVVGGGERQYQVWLKPERLAAHGITVAEVAEVLNEVNANTPAGVINDGGTEYLVTGMGRFKTIADIESVVIATRDGTAIKLRDMAEVRIGEAFSRGTGSANGQSAVLMFIQRQPQANTLALDRLLEQTYAEEAARLPEGMILVTDLMRQADFIRTAISNVAKAIRDGAILMIIIMILFLFNVRALVISLTALPLSIIAAVLVIYFFGGTINTMTLGGLAIAIGSLMDDAVIDVENTVRRLRQNKALPKEKQRAPLRVVYEASSEVRSAIVSATVIITVVFLPLYTLTDVEGRLLRPLGTAYIVSIFASLLVALTLTPALEALLLPKSRAILSEKEPGIAVAVRRGYGALLRPVMRHPWIVSLPIVAAFIIAVGSFFFMGRAFLPDFNEGALNVVMNTLPGTSLEESDRIGSLVEKMLLETDEVTSVARKTGRGELDEHAQGIEGSEMEATYTLKDRSKEEMLADIRARLGKVPGITFGLGGPIAHRIDHMLSGARAGIAIKISGDDLHILRDLAEEAEVLIKQIPGVTDVAVEPQTEVPELRVYLDRERLSRNRVSFVEAGLTLRAALYGAPVSRVYEGRNAYDLVLRMQDKATDSVAALEQLPLRTDTGALVPLGAVSVVSRESGPNIISRDQVQRKIFVVCNPAGRDVASVLADIRAAVDPLLKNKSGYSVHYGGQFESAAAASQRLLLSGLLIFAIIFAILGMTFRNLLDAAFVMASLPLALIGGVAAVFLLGGVLSIASIIGFISVFGVAARNGIMLINHIRHLQQEEGVTEFREAVWRGSVERVIPVLMTAISTGLALVPLVIARNAPGNEIQSPMAVVIIGGLLSATILNMIIVPALYFRFGRPVTKKDGMETLPLGDSVNV
ncbi:MAG: efflux RND transporter permease subunit [Candidatus Hydrogenedentales bacterium]|jgi:CzcA family heavy metal efflux pump